MSVLYLLFIWIAEAERYLTRDLSQTLLYYNINHSKTVLFLPGLWLTPQAELERRENN